MRFKLLLVTLAVQVCTVAVLFAFSGPDTLAYPMEAGYVLKNQNLDLVYYEGVPAQLTYQKMDAPARRTVLGNGSRVVYKKIKSLRCERRMRDDLPVYRCALDLHRL